MVFRKLLFKWVSVKLRSEKKTPPKIRETKGQAEKTQVWYWARQGLSIGGTKRNQHVRYLEGVEEVGESYELRF